MVANGIRQLIRDGVVKHQAKLARCGYVSRARLTQIMNLLCLAPDIQEEILFLPPTRAGYDAKAPARVVADRGNRELGRPARSVALHFRTLSMTWTVLSACQAFSRAVVTRRVTVAANLIGGVAKTRNPRLFHNMRDQTDDQLNHASHLRTSCTPFATRT